MLPRLLLGLALVVLVGCPKDSPPSPPPDAAPTVHILSPQDGASLSGGTLTLEGEASDAEDGPLRDASLRWSSSVDGELGSGSPLRVTLTRGTHRLSLDVADSHGQTARAQVSVTVSGDNRPPAVSIESPRDGVLVPEGAPITLRGRATDPEDGALGGASLTWTSDRNGVIGTGTQVTLGNAALGTHRILLTAVDAYGISGYASLSLTVVPAGTNLKPSVTITSPTEGSRLTEGLPITLEGSATDPEDGPLADSALAWTSSLAGPLGTGRKLSSVTLASGVHTLTLTATDSGGASEGASVLVTVSRPGTTAPVVLITQPSDGYTLFEGTALTLAGSATDAEEGRLIGSALRWTSSLDGELGTGESLSVSSLSRGKHEVRLTATDSSSTSAAARIQVEVLPRNAAPTVRISSPADGSRYTAGQTVSLRGSAEDVEDGQLTGNRLTWRSSLDNELGVGASLDVASLRVGRHQLSLTALDSGGRVASASILVTIDPSPVKLAPLARLTGPEQAEARQELTFDASSSSDPDGTLQRYRFDFQDGSPIVEGTAAQVRHTFAAAGTYTVTLTVTDNDGLTGTTSRTVTVTPYVRRPAVLAEGSERYGSVCQLSARGDVLHLLFRAETHPSIWYGTLTGSTWSMEQVEGLGMGVGGLVSTYMAMAVAADGTPHLAYWMTQQGQPTLWYATRGGTGAWVRERINLTSAPANGIGNVSIVLDPARANRPTVVFDSFIKDSSGYQQGRVAVAWRTGPNTWAGNPVSYIASQHQFLQGDAVISSDGTVFFPFGYSYYGEYFLGSYRPGGGLDNLSLSNGFSGGLVATSAWSGSDLLLLSSAGLLQLTPEVPLSGSTSRHSPVEEFTLQQAALAVDANGGPRLALAHSGLLEVVRRGPEGYWVRTANLSAMDSARIDADVDAEGETRVCFFRSGKLILY
ncbi:PKD domain-containing protein [Archangium violaceum]|uniref:PKD domain-containing protein n=1 Tax=Archangium violaceum TaxID=83451 RepID=UPI00194FEFF1|nr:PKD domain-containing protein [Archangium violaceum]QRN99952.1 PKD domain-containing protein [Archangium violaceum]